MKKLHTETCYWSTFTTGNTEWPALNESLSTKVLIIGGGLSGLLTAFMLHEFNIEFVLVEGKEISEGSSLASTGLLQYSSDIMLHELRKAVGKQKADLFYLKCYHALEDIRRIAAILHQEVGDCQLKTRSSMQYCSDSHDISKLQKEFAALSSINLPCELWDQRDIEQHFPFSKKLGLITHQDAEVNPHLFVIRLAQYLSKHGKNLFEHSIASSIKQHDNGSFSAVINDQHTIQAEYLIHATGYQYEQLHLPSLQLQMNRSYVIVTEPISDLSSWHNNMMLWETARPYLYMRTTFDARAIIGGLDETSSILNQEPSSVLKHNEKLINELNHLFPSLHATVAHSWNAYFVEPKDRLPYIGTDGVNLKHIYILGYGGNGTVYSMLGAQLAAHMIKGSCDSSELELTSLLSLAR